MATSSSGHASLAPGQEHHYTFTYAVTTPRLDTTVTAELRFADGSLASGWTLRAQAGQGAWTGGGPRVEVVERGAQSPNSAFTLALAVQAPASLAADQTVSLHITGTASTERGVETGVASGGPLASLTVIAPTPTPLPDLGELDPVGSETKEVDRVEGDGDISTATKTPTEPAAAPETHEPESEERPGADPDTQQEVPATPTMDSDAEQIGTATPGGGDEPAAEKTEPMTPDSASKPTGEPQVQERALSQTFSMPQTTELLAESSPGKLSCAPESPATVAPGAAATFDCQATGYENAAVRVSTESTGWTVVLGDSDTTEVALPDTGEFTVTLTPGNGNDVAPEATATVGIVQTGEQGEAVVASLALTATIAPPEDESSVAPSVTCTPEHDGTVQAGDVVTFNCTTDNDAPVQVAVTEITAGWEYRIADAGDAFTTDLAPIEIDGGSISIEMRATDHAAPGEGSLVLEFRGADSEEDAPGTTVTLSATLEDTPSPTVDDLDMSCDPSAVSVAPGRETDVTCTITSTSNEPVSITEVKLPELEGWTTASEPGETDSTAAAIATSAEVSADQSYVFSFALSPSCAAPGTAQTLDVSATVVIDGESLPGPATTIEVALSGEAGIVVPPGVQAQSIDFGALTWDGTGYPAAQRTLTLSLQGPDNSCASTQGSWELQISTPGMVGTTGATIPASAISYIGPSSALPDGVTPAAGPMPLATTSTTIARIDGDMDGDATLEIDLQLVPPADTPPDAYTATINVSVVNGQ